MQYLTFDEFKTFNTGIDMPKDEFDRLEMYAAADIDALTMNRIVKPCKRVKKAAAFQIAHLYLNGGIETLVSGSSLKTEKIGNYQYEFNSDADVRRDISPAALKILYPTGLLYRGGNANGGGAYDKP
ncbi:MAG: hypothetical protein FWF15_05145 [Oscillospiraceae bacterium]|nr:hypothetical protein [Oscillospiraceae bacterium]